MPGSGINSADAELILQFLTYYTTVARGGGTTGGEVPSEHGAALAGSSHAQPASAEETHDAR